MGGGLKKVYAAYEAETEYRRIEEEQRGQWITIEDDDPSMKAMKKFDSKLKNISSGCISCNSDFGKGQTYFSAYAIDKVRSGALSSFGSYQWSCVEPGSTSFQLCFDDFRKGFPKTFKDFSHSMLGEEPEPCNQHMNELHLSAEFLEAMGGSGEKMIEELLEKMSGEDKNIRIVRRLKKDGDKKS